MVLSMVIIKEVKQYSDRKRINITNKDELNPGDKVAILLEDEYNTLMQEHYQLIADNERYQDNETNIKDIIELAINPINKEHEKEINKKDKIIESKKNELTSLKSIINKFMIDINGLSAIDVIFKKKHQKLINDLYDSVWVKLQPDRVENVEVEKLPE